MTDLHPVFAERVDDMNRLFSSVGLTVPEAKLKRMRTLSRDLENARAGLAEAAKENFDELDKVADGLLKATATTKRSAVKRTAEAVRGARVDDDLVRGVSHRLEKRTLEAKGVTEQDIFDAMRPQIKPALEENVEEARAAWADLPEHLKERLNGIGLQYATSKINLDTDSGAEIDALRRVAAAFSKVETPHGSVLVHSLRLNKPLLKTTLKHQFDASSAVEFGEHGALTAREEAVLWVPVERVHETFFRAGGRDLAPGEGLSPIIDVFGEDKEEFEARMAVIENCIQWFISKMPRPRYKEEIFDRAEVLRNPPIGGKINWENAGFHSGEEAYYAWKEEN